MWLADRLLAQRQFDLLVFRLDILPIAPLYITRRHRLPYALKTLGQGMANILNEKGGLLGRSLVGVNRRMVRQLVDRALVAELGQPVAGRIPRTATQHCCWENRLG